MATPRPSAPFNDVPRAPLHFRFAWTAAYRLAAAPFGVTPANSRVTLLPGVLDVRFGPWFVRVPRVDIEQVSITGPYGFVKTAGPAHVSLADRGVTFASNGHQGVCLQLRRPVVGAEPFRALRSPGVTVTVADCAGLYRALTGELVVDA